MKRKKDRLIREAFEVYQSGSKHEFNDDDDFYPEGFEDKIFNCIEKMHIKNPRTKAHIIYIGCVIVLIACLLSGIYVYYQSQSSVRTTQQIEKLWKEACNAKGLNIQERFIYADVSEAAENDTMIYEYQTVTLNVEQKKQFEKYHIDCHKTEKKLEVYTSEMESLVYETGKTIDDREVYQLSDRLSEEYFVLKEDGELVGLAKYVGTTSESVIQGTVSSKEICEDIFGLTSVEKVRSITLERFQERSKDNTDKLLAIYTKSKQQKEFLSRFIKENKIILDTKAFNMQNEKTMQLIEGTYGKTWEEVTKEMPEKCYLLGFENIYRETWVMGLIVEGNSVQIYIDTNLADEVHYLELDTTDQEWLSNLVQEADKTY